MKNSKYVLWVCFSLMLVNLRAEIKLPRFFSDNMVLQRDKPIKVWGWQIRMNLSGFVWVVKRKR